MYVSVDSSAPSIASTSANDSIENQGTIDLATEIRQFLSQTRFHKSSELPQNPWTVPAGHYLRSDGSVVHIEGPDRFRRIAANASVSSSL
ncbi:hypothetical protein P153DRAFT_366758 [Dothidotthia symphoricarpi CBS 119687]|uniref:Uncharacterized protein n=1 Tax=Dothidotthia symphoricarpi CBS 119687 TaxID=1392245 RepID=A0A6A6AC17_9PLEO|nr:uncharacterized protein P153DRAFT_366758 [Dothidotthia symphoricarpi CBS 119687]KAF2129359.1 hypothetical protein P153DRAFT_366758 [Dothidotthia symphoricarpi CBS 119687]